MEIMNGSTARIRLRPGVTRGIGIGCTTRPPVNYILPPHVHDDVLPPHTIRFSFFFFFFVFEFFTRRSRVNYILPRHVHDGVLPPDPISSIPWQAGFAILLPALGGVLQVHFQASSSSPLHTHPIHMWTIILSLLIYSFALSSYFNTKLSSINNNSHNLWPNLALVSGSLASAMLISIFVSTPLQPFVLFLWLLLLFFYFAPTAAIIKKCEKAVISFVSNVWRLITGTNMWKLITGTNNDPTTISP